MKSKSPVVEEDGSDESENISAKMKRKPAVDDITLEKGQEMLDMKSLL